MTPQKSSPFMRAMKFLVMALIICFSGVAILAALLEGIRSTELPVTKVAFAFTWHQTAVYTVGFLVSIVIGLFIANLVMRHYRRRHNTKFLLLRVFLIAISTTAILILYSNIIFPMVGLDERFGTTLLQLRSSYVFFEGAVVFCLSLTMGFILNIIVEIRRKLGNKVLMNFLLGKYKTPIEERKTLLFLDLTGSTTIAERIGHKKYAEFLQDFYFDVGEPISSFNGDVYSYVGDEIVITWYENQGHTSSDCINCFFAIMDKIDDRKDYYEKTYGFFPKFKAGVHTGKAMVAEIGYVKVFVCYLGDALNTTARVIGKCDELKSKLLISKEMYDLLSEKGGYQYIFQGDFQLKGKKDATGIYSVERS